MEPPTDEAAHVPPKVDFLGVPLAAVSTDEFLELFLAETLRRRAQPALLPYFVTYLNAACSNLAQVDADYRQILRRADLVYADGQAIVWASRWLRQPVPERVNAADFFVEFCRRCAQAGLSLYFLGSQPGVAARAAQHLIESIPALTVLGTESGYFSPDDREILQRIQRAAPDILIVGMGVPRQEQWVVRHLPQLGVASVWCVGALFEYYAGFRPRAPKWMRRAGLEWLFRLALEPRRLWRRYVIGNVVFLARIAKALWLDRALPSRFEGP